MAPPSPPPRPPRRRRHDRTLFAVLGSLLVHLALLAGFARQAAPDLPIPPSDVRPSIRINLRANLPNPPAVRPTLAARRAKPTRQPGGTAPPAAVAMSSPPAAASALTAPAGAASSGATRAGAEAPAGRWAVRPELGGDQGRLAQALRSRYDCLGEDASKLTRQARADCETRVGRDARLAHAGAAMDEGKRAYFDAVENAYQAIHDLRPTYNARGEQTLAGHPPSFGCKIGGKGAPPNSLKLGPCFVAPPQGVLTEESAVPKPY